MQKVQVLYPWHGLKYAHRGLSLLEVLLFCLTLSILLSQAEPAMRELVLRHRLQGAAQALMVDLQQARGEAVAPAWPCSSASARTHQAVATRSIGVRANVQNMGFQARQGAVTNTGSVEIRIGDGLGIRHVVSIASRVRSCAINGKIAGLPVCQA